MVQVQVTKQIIAGYNIVSARVLTEIYNWREEARRSIKTTLEDPIVSRLLPKSSVTRAQFETLLIDQLGHDLANKRLTREEMAQLMRNRKGISRGAMNRTLRQARNNVSAAIHTVLLLGYGGIFESPSLAPFVEASEQLKTQTTELRESGFADERLYRVSIEQLLRNLEEAFQAIYGRKRSM